MRKALPKSFLRAAAATRILPCTAMRMPSWPTSSEKVAPSTKAQARPNATTSWAWLPNISVASAVGTEIHTLAKSTNTRMPMKGKIVRNCWLK